MMPDKRSHTLSTNKKSVWPRRQNDRGRVGTIIWLVMILLGLGQLLLRRPLKQFWQTQGRSPTRIRRESRIEYLSQIAMSVFATMGLMVLRRPESTRMGWLMLMIGFISNLESFCKDYALFAYFANPAKKHPFRALAGWLQHWIWTTRILGLFIFLPLLFPNGRLPSHWWRPFLHQVIAILATHLPGYMFADIPLENGFTGLPTIQNPFSNQRFLNRFKYVQSLSFLASLPTLFSLWQLPSPTPWRRLGVGLYFAVLVLTTRLSSIINLILMCLVSAASLIWRWRSATPDERQQIKWLVYVSTLASGLWSINNLPTTTRGQKNLDWWASFQTAYRAVLIGSPIALGLAIMKYRLYDIDALIKRTLVYVPLTSLVIGIYSAVVSLLSKLFHRQTNNTFSALIATGIVAVLFQPLRERLQQLVNRRLYGERDDPIGVMTKLGDYIETGDTISAVLPTLIETMATVLKLPYVGLQIGDSTEINEPQIAVGERSTELELLPLLYQGSQIGQLMIAPRAPGEAFSQADQRLLAMISQLTATVVHTINLTEALQASRLRVVTSREEERRRIRRDLHDGLGPTLASQTFKLDAALELVERDPQAASELLTSLKTQTQTVIADIRQLVYALRPPAIDQLGLAGALQAHVDRLAGANVPRTTLQLRADHLQLLPAAVEVAVYRIVLEGINNVIRHANAQRCTVRLTATNTQLTLSIEDDGQGLSEDAPRGVGLTAMRERVDELGGQLSFEARHPSGTRIVVHLPISGPDEYIVSAASEDLPLVMEIISEAAAWLKAKGIDQWPSPPNQHWWRRTATYIEQEEIYIAYQKGIAVGTFRLTWADAYWPDDGLAGYVHSVAIRDQAHGKGMGRRLLDWAEIETRHRQRSYLRLDCAANNARLRQYYEAQGFRYQDQVSDHDYVAALYEKPLSKTSRLK